MEIWYFLLIFIVGVVAGFINTLAGGGSLLTIPVLIFLGLPAAVANGTNRLALLVQNIFAVIGFKRKGISDFKSSLLMSGPALVGTFLGARIAIDMSDIVFKRVLAVIIVFVIGLILFNPVQRNKDGMKHYESLSQLNWFYRIMIMIAFFFIGIYSGFIQAGVGLIIIVALTTLGGLNLVNSNSHKVFIIGVNVFFSLIIFAIHKKIYWPIGLALAAGNGLGGWIGSHFAVTRGDRLIRIILTICVIIMALKLAL